MTRGYFGIGAEGISKPMNMGNIIRSAHAFGASFVFTVDAHKRVETVRSDTSKTLEHLPYYAWASIDEMALPEKCQLVGIELRDNAHDLPSFRHPQRAAYVLGPEAGSLSDRMIGRCDHLIKIPTAFCLNVQIAAAIVMYDRVRSLGGWAERPMMPGPAAPKRPHVHGKPVYRGGRLEDN